MDRQIGLTSKTSLRCVNHTRSSAFPFARGLDIAVHDQE